MLALVLAASPVRAQPPLAPTSVTERQDQAASERRNEIALVAAGTADIEEEKTYFTLGLEYERRIGERFGVVTEAEYQFVADSWIVAAPFVVHPVRGLKLFAGPGFEHAGNAEEDDEEVKNDEDGDATRFLFRVGGAYVVELAERYSIGPTVSVDFVRERGEWAQSLTFGMTFGVAF